MHLYIIRHAQSENNAMWAMTGTNEGRVADPALTPLGHKQAERVADHLAHAPDIAGDNQFAQRHNLNGYGLTHLYTSLMIRSITTAGYIAESTGLPLLAWPEIHERGGLHEVDEATGEDKGIEGPDRAFFEKTYPHLILPVDMTAAGWWGRPQEDVVEAEERARIVWQQLRQRHGETDDRVAIVTHGGFFQSLLSVLASRDPDRADHPLGLNDLWFGISNASISRIEVWKEFAVVRYINRIDHMPPELITG